MLKKVIRGPIAYWSAVLLAAALLAGCGVKTMRPVPADQAPYFTDDMSVSSLRAAAENSLAYLRKLPPDRTFTYDRDYSAAWLMESLETFITIMENAKTMAELNREISEQFTIYQTGPAGLFGRGGRLLVTGYYEPFFEASLSRRPPYIYPLYRIPPDLVSRPAPDSGRNIGRLENDRLTPYWSRAEIESRNLLAGHELVYLADPVDAFVLHVQGSGKVRLRDGSVRGVHYAAANGRKYSSIGKLLVDEGKIELAEASLPRIRQYMAAHPEEIERILHHNESFIFFKWGKAGGLVGSLGETLTPGRSVAADREIFPPGALAFLQTEKPVVEVTGRTVGWEPMSRFVLIQDSGSAIKGVGRLDLFWGGGVYARTVAGLMKQPGKLFFLVKKEP